MNRRERFLNMIDEAIVYGLAKVENRRMVDIAIRHNNVIKLFTKDVHYANLLLYQKQIESIEFLDVSKHLELVRERISWLLLDIGLTKFRIYFSRKTNIKKLYISDIALDFPLEIVLRENKIVSKNNIVATFKRNLK